MGQMQQADLEKALPGLEAKAEAIHSDEWVATARGVAKVIEGHIAEQVCSFVGDMNAILHQKHKSDHHPVMVSWSQAMALRTFLHSRGFTGLGYQEHRDITRIANKPGQIA